MSTTIDSLEIKIESDSSRAAQGIDSLATSLGNLKQNGKIGTAVKNLNNLSSALKSFTSVTSNANKITSLATALQSLKNVGSMKGTGNAIEKMATSLKSLTGVNTVALEKVANSGPLFERVAAALGRMSGVKAGGLGTMVNALGKIGDVTAKLDDKAIDDFAARVAKLNEKLTPLSGKMTTIQAGLRGVNSSAKAAGTGMNTLGTRVNKTALNLASLTTVIQGAISALRPVVNLLTDCISQAMEWDGVVARFGRGFGDQAQEVYDWIQKLNKEMGINTQTFMQYSSVFSTMLQGFGVGAEDSAKMALGYTELVYDIWAGYNDVYKNFGDAADAVKSAIAGEVEPIRRAGFTIVESTLEQTAANHGLEISLANATEAQKSYLRYLTLVDQAHAQNLVGTYAREMNTAEGVMRTFSQQLKSLAQALGSLFLPVLVKIMPYLQAFVELLGEAIAAIAAFFGVEIQKVDWGGFGSGGTVLEGVGDAADSATGSLDDATDAAGSAKKAIEDLKRATIGIDELNVISPPDKNEGGSGDSGGAGGAGGGAGGGFGDLDVDSLWDDSIFGNIQSQVDEIKEKLKDWMPVIETIGIGLGALAIAKLLNNLGTALSQMDALSGAIAGIAIATIEAALVFIFADDYLETGNLMSLVGEAVATALGSYLLYKTWGDKGLVVGLAVSIAAQLVAITLNLADGGVEMSDPQLWIQSAFTTALAGTAGGWMAYKGLIPMSTGQGIGIGVLVGLSLTLAAITIGDITADGVQFSNVLTGALSTLIGGGAGAAIFTALGIATGGAGFLVGAAIMLAVNVIGAIIGTVSKDAEKTLEEDLESRFGEIELDAEELAFYVDKITAIPREVTIDSRVWNEKLGEYETQTMTVSIDVALEIFKDENAMLETIRARVTELEKELDSKNIKIALGMEVAYEDYAATIDSYVSAAQEYLDQYYLTANIALDITGADKDGSLATTLDTFYLENTAKLTQLGSKLKSTISDAFVDGEWIPEKLEEARKLQAEIQEVINYVSDVEYRAKLQSLTLEVTGDKLTVKSFKGVLEGAQAAIEEKLAALEEVKMSQLKVAIMEYDANIAAGMSEAEAKKIYDQTVADIEAEYQKGKLEVQYGTVDFGLDTLQTTFATELALAKDKGLLDFNVALDYALGTNLMYDEEGFYQGIYQMTGQMAVKFQSAIRNNVDPVVRQEMAELVEAMKPTMKEYESIAEANRKSGITVTESIREGLNDYSQLAALSGDQDAINYLIGQGFSTDPTFLKTLAISETAGKEIDESIAKGLLNNIQYVRDEASGLIIGIKDTVNNKTIQLTPAMEKNLSDLGVNMGDALGGKYSYIYDETTGVLEAIVDSATGNEIWVNNELKSAGQSAGSSLSAGVLEGAESEMAADKKSWLDWAIWPWNWFKKENEINSPSKLFERGGKYLTDGLKNGMETNSLKDKLSSIWDKAKEWWNGKKGLEKASVAVGLVKSGWSTVKGWIGSIPGVSQAVSLAKSGWSTVKGWVGSIPKLSQAIGLTKSGWSTIKKWIGSIPKISQSVGLTKSGWSSVKKWVGTMPTLSAKISLVKNGWTSIKKWLGNLDYKLNFKLPKIKVEWGSKTYAGFTIKYPKGFSTYAKGGFPDMGEMFIAREAGPEMVGRIGNRTTVANNDQIVEGISEGVYAAVVAAMKASENGGSQAVNVYLDGRQIYASTEQHRKERGANLMGNQVYSY